MVLAAHCLRLSNKKQTKTKRALYSQTIYAHIYISKLSVSDRCWKHCFVLLYWRLCCSKASWMHCFFSSAQLTAQNRRRERQHCAGRVRPRALRSALVTSSNWTIRFIQKSLQVLSVCIFYGRKLLIGLKVVKYSVKVALLCERRGSWWQRMVDIRGGRCGYCWWLLSHYILLVHA